MNDKKILFSFFTIFMCIILEWIFFPLKSFIEKIVTNNNNSNFHYFFKSQITLYENRY